MRLVLPTEWGMTMLRTLTESTSGSLAHPRCAMWSGCEELPASVQPNSAYDQKLSVAIAISLAVAA